VEKPRATDGAGPPELLHHEDRARFIHLPRRVPFLVGANGNRGRRHCLRGESRPGDRAGHQLPGNGRSPRDAGKSRRRSHRHPHPGNDSFSLAKSLAKSLTESLTESLADAIAYALTPAIRYGIAARIPYMPAKSKKQQMAAGAALSAKRGEASKSSLKGASRQMEKSMSEKQLEEIAHTKRKSLPKKKG